MRQLIVSFDQIESEISRLDDLANQYREMYGNLFNKVDESNLYWKGKDQEAFMNKFQESESDFNKLHQLFKQYIEFLEKSVDAYRLCQDEAQASMLRL